MTQSSMLDKHCRSCGTKEALNPEQIKRYSPECPEWKYENETIRRTISFKNYYETTAFVNGVIWIAHRENHHPDIQFGYKECTVVYSTHSAKGITENDFICAKKIDELLDGWTEDSDRAEK